MHPALPWLLALPLLAGCGGIADEFQSNTEKGRFEVSIVQVANATPPEVTELKHYERLRVARPLLGATLPLGAMVHVEAAASDYGVYRFGSGWITRGDFYLGTHTVRTAMVEVGSSNPGVVRTEMVLSPADPQRRVTRLVMLQPGSARITFRASKLDARSRPTGAIVEDSMVITVPPGPAR